ncbi:MAG: ribosome biogenesis GTP-binding protein YihA/YsxC [Endomicrobium sp.]|jgi:GTP-binding protein|nr:ribosome biogenesis GTP-binding protein YihA/YsxC [Endomicrobium sp.]
MLKNTVFFRAVSNIDLLSKSVVEVIFSGRSNVGKSSVINALCLQKNLARTSKTPGRTRSINIYSVAMKKWIIDLPGYGFARGYCKKKNIWESMVEKWILKRKTKKIVYIIVDAFIGPTELDFAMASWLNNYSIAFKIVANKCDKISTSISNEKIQSKVSDCFAINVSNVFMVSAKKGNGFCNLQIDIVKFLSCC